MSYWDVDQQTLLMRWLVAIGSGVPDTDSRSIAQINREAAALADRLAPEFPFATDEPDPDLTVMWNTPEGHVLYGLMRKTWLSEGLARRQYATIDTNASI